VATGTVFRTNKTQAVRIPKAVAFPEHVKQVQIVPDGDRLILVPVPNSWTEWFAMFGNLEDSFPERDQGVAEKRDAL
jgi:antitoxin VapB